MDTNSHIITSTPQLCPVVTSDLAIHLAKDGPARFQINGVPVTIDQGDGLFLNAGQIVLEQSDTLCLKVTAKYLHERAHWQSNVVDRIQEKKIQPFLVLHRDNEAEKAVLDGVDILASIWERDPASYAYLAPGMVYSLYQTLVRRIDETCTLEFPPDDQVRCRDLMKYFADHYTERVNLPDAAAVFKVTPNTCIKTFRKYIGITPIDYLNLYRMNMACLLLRTTKKKIADIAIEVGVPDKSYFTASFKKMVGQTPSKYRKQNTPQAG